MKKVTCSLVLLALLGLGMMPTAASAEGRIAVYFDAEGTQRGGYSTGLGQLQLLYIYGEGFDGEFVTGVQYKIDYGPDLDFITDVGLPAVYIGTSATGISMGFGMAPRTGERFLVHMAFCSWNNQCFNSINNEIRVLPHPQFSDETPIATVFPGQDIVQAEGTRSWSCYSMELDIKPAGCPNPFNINLLDWLLDMKNVKALLPTAILGNETVDVTQIDVTSVLLEGVPATRHSYEDVATPDGRADCACNDYDGDGYMDLTLKFNKHALAAALIGNGYDDNLVGDQLTLTATGVFLDGTPFEVTDCITLVGNPGTKVQLGTNDAAGLGFPTPNPFNPVTRISYNVPATQHVRIAIYDVAGRMVEDLVNQVKAPGEYIAEWDAGRLPSGVYFYRMQTGDRTLVRRATLLK